MTSNELRTFLDKIAAGRDGVPISIDEAQQISALGRAAVLKRFRELQDEGEGYLRLGRHGHPTRFYFRSASIPPQSMAPTLPTRPALEPTASSLAAGEAAILEWVEHKFPLRPGLRLSLRLPADLTDREAGRLGKFIEALPL